MSHKGDSGTHYCCNTRLATEGGKARCCPCVPHENCDFQAEIDELAKRETKR